MQTWLHVRPKSQRLPRQLFLVGGAPRSRTTWLEHILDAHPNIAAPAKAISCISSPHRSGRHPAPAGPVAGPDTRLFRDLGGYPLPDPNSSPWQAQPSCWHWRSNAIAIRIRSRGEQTRSVFGFPNLKRLFPARSSSALPATHAHPISAWHLSRKSGARGCGGSRSALYPGGRRRLPVHPRGAVPAKALPRGCVDFYLEPCCATRKRRLPALAPPVRRLPGHRR